MPVDVRQAQLRAGVGALFADDDAHPRRPLRQVEQTGDLSDPGAGTDLAAGVVSRRPDLLGDQLESVGDVIRQPEPDVGVPPLGAYDSR